jgi:methionyl-tRNA synthetase
LFATTALPYANGPFHVGHIMEYIQADIWVRFQRMQGHTVHFVCADDAHGAPIMIAAEKAGITPQPLWRHCSRPQALPRRLSHRLRPLAQHRRAREPRAGAKPSTATLKAAGLIDVRTIEQFFDPGQHVPARPLHQGHLPELRRERPVRRQLRGLRRGVRAHRPDRPVFGADRARGRN